MIDINKIEVSSLIVLFLVCFSGSFIGFTIANSISLYRFRKTHEKLSSEIAKKLKQLLGVNVCVKSRADNVIYVEF